VHLISVYPIIKGNWASELQYWSKADILPGSLVKVPLKGKSIFALVFKSASIQEAKGEIKGADFKIRKIEDPEPIDIVRKEYIRATMQTSSFFVQPVGAMLKAVIPAVALSHISASQSAKIDMSNDAATNAATNATDPHDAIADIVAISTNKEDRLSVYKSLIREVLARKKSIILVAPTVRIAEELYDSIRKGIEHVSILLHGSLLKKKMDDGWKEALKADKGIVLVCTPQYMCIPRNDIETIVLEKESSRAYKTFQPPFFDWRTFAETYSKLLGIRLMYGDQLLSIETIHRIQELEINEPFPLSFRIQKEAEVIIIDQKADRNADRIANAESIGGRMETPASSPADIAKSKKDSGFHIMSEELISMIEYSIQKEQKMFIFSARRGLSPQTVCGHCGTTVTCRHCKSPVVLHKNQKSGERYFLCHHCGKERGALEACSVCNSWNLVTLGIGTDTVYEEVKKRFPDVPLYRIDKDNAKTDKETKKLIKDFKNETGSAVLVGTELALAYLDSMPYVAVASMDSLFSIPDFRIHERIAHICLRLLEVTRTYLLIQTRNAESPLIKAFFTKTFADFVHEELEVRRKLDYPPFSLMGKISLSGKADEISKQAKQIEESLRQYEPVVFPAFIPSQLGVTINILFKLPEDIWRNPTKRTKHELFQKLTAISQITPIYIQPESFI
jgi:primosomal protein N'